MGQIAGQAKPEDDFLLLLIGHGTFDGVEYKLNLAGPDLSGAGPGEPLQPHPRQAPTGREYHQRQRRLSGRAAEARPRRDCCHQVRHREERHGLRALLGRGAARRQRRRGQERSHQRAGSLPVRHAQDRGFLRVAEAAGHRARHLRRHRQESEGVRAASTDTGEGMLLSSFTLLRIGAAQRPPPIRPSARCSTRRKSSSARSTR